MEQKQAGFQIEDDDTREAAWQQEKQDREQKELHTNMSDHKAKRLFFESNEFLSQPLQIALIKKDARGTPNEDEKSTLGLQVLQLKAELKQEKHPELSEQPLGRQLCFLQQKGIWEDDITRELVMQEEEKAHLKILEMAKEGNFSFKNWLNPTKPPLAIQDSQPMLALENSAPALTMEAETYSEDDTDVEDPPDCPVHLMC